MTDGRGGVYASSLPTQRVWSRISHAFRQRGFTPSHPYSQLTATSLLNAGRQDQRSVRFNQISPRVEKVVFAFGLLLRRRNTLANHNELWHHTRSLTKRLAQSYYRLLLGNKPHGIFACSTTSGHFKKKSCSSSLVVHA